MKEKMDLNNISTTIKDTSRSIYIQLLAGKTHNTEPLINDIKCLEDSLCKLKAMIMIEHTGYIKPSCQESDLKGLAQREALR